MAADTAEKRRAAQNISCPWRGPSYPTGGDAGQRAAGIFLYSGITGGAGGGSPPSGSGVRTRKMLGGIGTLMR